MRKIIWAITAVFSIQVAFQLLMTAERSDGEYAAMQTPLRDPVTSYVDAGLDEDDLEIPAMPPYQTALPEGIAVRRQAEVASIPTLSSHLLQTQKADTAAPFKPVIITYDRSGAITEAATVRRAERPPSEERVKPTDDRPTIAKIVTKPFDLLKAVASKLH